MNSSDFVLFALQITVMLGCALLFGELMRRIHQPAVLGEMAGGILIGPTIFGAVAPTTWNWLFTSSANATSVREASIKLGMLFFLFVAGSEVDLSDLRRVGKRAAMIGLVGTLVPIFGGVGLVYLLPRAFWGQLASQHFFAFALFIGMNLANSANPVIARVLMDLGLLKEEFGTMVMTATIVDDLINWTLFAIILNNISPSGESAASMPASIAMVLVFFVAVLGIGRWLGPRGLHWMRGHLSWPTGFIALTALLILFASSAAEQLGIHAFLGAFLVGAALGGHDKEHVEAHRVISHFALGFFAPIYFVSMGLNANFVTNFDWALVLLMIAVAYLTKTAGVLLGARLAGMPVNREVLAISMGLNARGATGIILAGVGLTAGVIDERIFVAVVVMALVTSITSGPAIKYLIGSQIQRAAVVRAIPSEQSPGVQV